MDLSLSEEGRFDGLTVPLIWLTYYLL